MSLPLIYVDRSEIRQGKLEELTRALKELTEFIERNEPQLIAYAAYFEDYRTRMTVIHVHVDADSLMARLAPNWRSR